MVFDFAFAIGAGLIIPMFLVHNYFSGKIKSHKENALNNYCRENADFTTEQYRLLMEKYRQVSEPPYDEIRKFYYHAFKNQFNSIESVIDAEEPSRWLNDALKTYFITMALFLITGLLPYVGFPEYSVPSLVVGVITFLIAVYSSLNLLRYKFAVARANSNNP